MRIIFVTDIHGNLHEIDAALPSLRGADVIVATGDITDFGGAHEADEVMRRLLGAAPRVFGVFGNCDYPGVQSYLAEHNMDLHGRLVDLQDVVLMGLGGSLPCPGRTPTEYTDEALGAVLDGLPVEPAQAGRLVLVTHQPPLDTLADSIRGGRHVGSLAVRRFIERHQPRLCATGHIHEGRGIDRIGSTIVANPGPLFQGYYTVFDTGAAEGHGVEILRVAAGRRRG